MSSRTIEIDLYRDWVAFLRSELSVAGYGSLPDEDEEIEFIYFNLLKRLIEPTARQVLKSHNFSCSSEYEPGLNEIIRKAEEGEDLTPHLSRLLKDQSYNDPLLNDWGIHHLHLSENTDNDGYVTRTGPLLFARFDQDNGYFINVMPHGSWALKEIVSTIHNNWPESISQFRIKGVIGLSRTVSDTDRAALRQGKVNSMVEIEEGIVYAPIGGGFSTSGLSVDVVRRADYCRETLRNTRGKGSDTIVWTRSLTRQSSSAATREKG